MKGFAKAILISIGVSAGLLLLTNFIAFFPWYSTLVVETFNLSQIAAGDNYVKQYDYDQTLNSLSNRPIFRKHRDKIKITILNADGGRAVGDDDEDIYYNLPEVSKPYRQRGDSLQITIEAVYPLQITIWGRPLERLVPITFSMNTVGLKHYKDLEYYFH